jgi:hypothetical protein
LSSPRKDAQKPMSQSEENKYFSWEPKEFHKNAKISQQKLNLLTIFRASKESEENEEKEEKN